VSGLHTGVIYALLVGLLTLGGRIKPRYENQLGRCAVSLTVIAAMWGYAALTGMTPSVVRAVVMVTLVEVGHMFYRKGVMLNSIAAAAVFILLVRPLDLFSVGFQLSFAATFAIVLLSKQLSRFRIQKVLVGTILVSIAAQLGTVPITMYYFGYASTYFLLTNLIVLPIVTLLVPCGLVSLVLGGTTVGLWWTKITFALSWLMNHSVGWIEALPGSSLPAAVNGWMVAVYYVLLLLLYAVVRQGKGQK